MEEYLNTLLEQIRCKKARPYIEEELRGHIKDQIADNICSGMDEATAEKAAVKDMGDPVETGISLDRVHRPQVAWGILILIALISLAGCIMHRLLCAQIGKMTAQTEIAYLYDEVSAQLEPAAQVAKHGSAGYVSNVMFGLAIMLFLYMLDYTRLARWSKAIAGAILGLTLYSILFGMRMNGSVYYIDIYPLRLSASALLMLYVPIYGAIIYQYHGSGYRGLAKSIAWMIVPVLLACQLPNLLLTGLLLVSMSVELTIALAKNWFRVSKKIVITGLWTCTVILPVVSMTAMYLFHLFKGYQVTRIRSFLTNSGEANYLTSLLRTYYRNATITGNRRIREEIFASLPNFNSDFMFTYLTAIYGVIAGLAVCCIMAALIMMVFGASIRQKNQLGMVMGCGCGMVLLLNAVVNILENVGLFPVTTTFLPFLSAGGSSIVLCYALVGIVLSIYRYKNIYPKHIKPRIPGIKVKVSIEDGQEAT